MSVLRRLPLGLVWGLGLLLLLVAVPPAQGAVGDQDGDTDIDVDDIAVILAARNTPAGVADPKDLDNDGTITVLDARIAAACCTRLLCATGNNAPTITAILDQSTDEDTATGPLAFTIGDPDGTPPGSLAVTATSSDQTLIPNGNLTLGGAGANRTIDVLPAADQNGGPATITVTVDDGSATADALFNVTVTPVNDAPTLDAIADPAAILEDAAQQTVNLTGITAGGGEAQVLAVTATSSVPGLIPDPTVTYTSADATGSLAYTPVADQSGAATITVTVMDDGGTASGGVNTVSRMFTVTVTAVNDPPALSTPHASAFTEGAGAVAIAPTITVTDADSANLASATVTLTNAQDGVAEQLGATACGGLTVIGAGTATLSISGAATLAAYQTCLQSVTYDNTSNAPTESPTRSINLVVNDGAASSNTAISSVTVTAVASPPMIANDPIAYTTAGNTQLKGGSGAMSTAVAYVEDASNIPTKASITDPDTPAGSLTYSLDSGPSNGSATVSATGNFLYSPNPGFVGADSFTYRVSDGVNMPTGTVDVTVADTDGVTAGNQVIWYVENDAAAGGDGTSTNPFDTLKDAESGGGASSSGDTIFVLEGDATTAKQDVGLVLAADQKLIGHSAATLVVNGVTIQTPSPGGRPKIEHTAGDAIRVDATSGNLTGVEIRGVELSATGGNALDVTSAGANNFAVLLESSVISGASAEGIDVNHASSGLGSVAVSNLSGLAATGSGFDARNTGSGDLHVAFDDNSGLTSAAAAGAAVFLEDTGPGSLFVTGFSNNTVLGSSNGDGVRILGAVFDSDPADPDFDPVAGGNLTVGLVGDRVPRGVTLGEPANRVLGNLVFGTVNIFSFSGGALAASGAGPSMGGPPPTAGFLLAIAGGTADALGGPAVALDPLTSSVVLTNVSSSNSAGAGISLNAVGGTFSAAMGGIVDSAGAGFEIIGGTVTATYGGGITQSNNAPTVSVSGGHNTGTVTFQTGTISATNGNGLQFDNADGTYQFTGTTTLAGGDAGIDLANGCDGAFSFGTGTAITSPTGAAFNLVGGTAGVTYSGNITQANSAPAVSISAGHTIGTVTFQTGTISASAGTGLQLDNADGFYNFNGTTTLAGGDAGIDILNGSAGTFGFGSGTAITSPTGTGFNADSSSANVDYAGSITQNNAATGVRLSANTGTATFRGGMTLNTGASTAFIATGGGTVEVCSDSNCSLPGGAVVVSTIGATTPVSTTAVNITGTAIGAENVTFRQVSVDGGGASIVPGIVLATTGAGQFHVTGTGAAGSGGTIENILADAVTLNNTDGRVTFEDLIIEDIGNMAGGLNTASGHDAIHGENVDGGLTLDNVTIRRISDNAIHGEPFGGPGFTNFDGLEILNSLIEDSNRYHDPSGCSPCGDDNNEAMVRIRGIKGTVRVIGSTLRRGAELLDLSSSSAMGDTLAVTVQSSTFNDSFKGLSAVLGAKGLACINVKVRGAADANVHIGDPLEVSGPLGNTFTGCATVAIAIKHDDAAATGDIDAIISRNTLDNSAVEAPPICCGTVGGPFGLGNWPQNSILLRARGTTAATMDAIISYNTLTTTGLAEGNEGSITVFHDGQTSPAVTAGTLQARVSNNTITRPFVAGVFVVAEKNTAARVLVEDNQIVGGSAMHPDFGATPVPGNSSKARTLDDGTLDVTVNTHGHGTSVTSTSPGFPEQDIVFTEPASASFKVQGLGNPSTLCASFSNNTSDRGYELREDTGSSVSLFRGASALPSCTTAAPIDCETVLNGLGNTGGPTNGAAGSGNPALSPPDVNVSGTSGTITLTGTACPLPTGLITGGSF